MYKSNVQSSQEVSVLSLFDGMSCGMIAMQNAGLKVKSYIAYEIDKYAIKTSLHNFPNIVQCGDVFDADFTQYEDIDFLIGGSPCTYWSISQKNNRETQQNGMGWELFQQYVRALKQAKSKFFIYENNKSMSQTIREGITEAFGFEPILINSALVSAQNRQRLYWVGKRNADGTYHKVDVEQPEDRGILLRDALEDGLCEKDKGYCLKHQAGNARDYFKKHHTNIKFEPVNTTADGKAQTIKAQYQNTNQQNICCYKSTYGASGVAEPIRVGCMLSPDGEVKNGQGMRVYSVDGKSVNQTAQGDGLGARTGLYTIPVACAAQRGRYNPDGSITQIYEVRDGEKTNAITTVQKDNNVVERVLSKNDHFAEPIEWNGQCEPIKAISVADGKVHIVYKVESGQITIKDKQYPIKLPDGYYIIRKLTVRECMRLQTVPEWYEFPVSDTRAYKMLGNGWTCDVITHLIKSAISGNGASENFI